MSTPAHRRFNLSPIAKVAQNLGSIIIVIAIAAFGFWGGHFLLPGQQHSASESEAGEPNHTANLSRVTLSPEELASANLEISAVTSQEFQEHRTVPGKIVYDASRKIALRATVDCVVKQTMVRPSQLVTAGQPLLLLTGPEIGSARNDISQCESTLQLLEKEYGWTLDTHTNLNGLLTLLAQSPSIEQIRTQFANKNLGEHRDEIISAYSELALARKLAERTRRLEKQGAISGKTADERRSAFEIATAKFNAVTEEMTFKARQDLNKAKAKVDAEKRHLEISRERLSALLGPDAEPEESNKRGVADFVLRAPRAGQVVALTAVKSARFKPGEVMMEIADTSDVWIEAQISQRDWHALALDENQALKIRVPAIPQQEFEGTVRHIGSTVSQATMAIPLTAKLNNAEGRFRPGMSVWVDIPTSESRSAIVVPIGAVQRNEMDTFVFVQNANATFERRDVVVGGQSMNRVEIQSGLAIGDKVVVEGAFFLKSELLLTGEE